jgi:hypothetical protein
MAAVSIGGCYHCGEPMWLERATYDTLKRSGRTFYCPHGHEQCYPLGKTAEQKLKEQLDEERRARQRAEQRVAEKADEARTAWNTATEQREIAQQERRRANGYKGHAAKITKRAKAGVCPCCTRSFDNLRRHMQTQHPTFTPEVADQPALH